MSIVRSSPQLLGMALGATVLLVVIVLILFWSPTPTPPPVTPPSPEEPRSGPRLLNDVTTSSGIAFTYRNGEETDHYTILESVGGGVALIDFDQDGLLDIYLPGGGTFEKGDPPRMRGFPGRLYRNLGDCKFRDVSDLVVTRSPLFYSHGVAVGDYDCDGWPDLLVTGYGRMALFRNEAGKRFVEVTEQLGLREERWTTSAAWVDLTGKGRPDLYVCRYLDWSFANDPRCVSKGDPKQRDVCEPLKFKPLPHALFRQDSGKFVDVSKEAGLRSDGMGLGVVAGDLDADGRPDLYVANDAGLNFLYLNRGAGRLEESALLSGVAGDDLGRYNGSMGVDIGDYDGSGRPSLWVTNYQGEYHALYRNLGGAQFAYQTTAAGIAALGQQYVAFGTGFLDLDNDGWLDLLFVNGHVLRHPVGTSFHQRPVLLRNVERHGRRFFTNISHQGGDFFSTPALGRGVAIGDLDNDGWPDVVISQCNTPVTILRNSAPREAGWIGVRLHGKNHRPVVGASVTLEVAGRTLTRFAVGGGSYLSAGDPRLLFGLGSAQQVDAIIVRWPWGTTQRYTGLQPGRYWHLSEGEAEPKPAPPTRR